jgi:hypothetical protein
LGKPVNYITAITSTRKKRQATKRATKDVRNANGS